MKKRFIKIGIVGILVIVAIVAIVLAFVLTRKGVVINSGISSGLSSYVKNDIWSTSARNINGHCRVDMTFTSNNLAAFRANSTNSAGKIFLKLKQGDVEKSIDISGEFNDKIDMSEFKPGHIKLRLEFEHAETVNAAIQWK